MHFCHTNSCITNEAPAGCAARYSERMTVNVRPATAEDAAALAAVAAVTFPLACPPHTTDEAKARFIATVLSEERFAAYLTDQARDVLIAETEDGTAIGYAMLVDGEPADPDVAGAIRVRPTIELSKCYVLPGHHGEGVAGLLMRASIDAATRPGGRGDLARRQRGERARTTFLRQARVRARRFEALSRRRQPRTRLGDGTRALIRRRGHCGRGQPSATLSTSLPRV